LISESDEVLVVQEIVTVLVEIGLAEMALTTGVAIGGMTVMVAVDPVEGSVIVRVPVAVPEYIEREAEDVPFTTCDAIEAPVPPLRVKVGVPGVPDVQEVRLPVRLTVLVEL